jgi:uncharacterized protein
VGTPITIVFDGSRPPAGPPETVSTPELEILYSRAGQTADDVIERVTHRLKDYGEVLAITDDYAERDTVLSMGGMAWSCQNFIQTVEDTLQELEHDIKTHNRRERSRYKDSPQS